MRPVLTHSRLRSSGGELDDSIDSLAPLTGEREHPRRSPRTGGKDLFDADPGETSTRNAVFEDSASPLAALKPKPLAEGSSRQSTTSSSNRLLEIAFRGGDEVRGRRGLVNSFDEEDVPLSDFFSKSRRTSPKAVERGGKGVFAFDAFSVDGNALTVDTAEVPRRAAGSKSMGSRRLPPVSPASDDVMAFDDGDLDSPSPGPRRSPPSLSRTNSWDSDSVSSPEAPRESKGHSVRQSRKDAATASALHVSKNSDMSPNSRRIVDSLSETDLRKAFDSCPRSIRGGINIGALERSLRWTLGAPALANSLKEVSTTTSGDEGSNMTWEAFKALAAPYLRDGALGKGDLPSLESTDHRVSTTGNKARDVDEVSSGPGASPVHVGNRRPFMLTRTEAHVFDDELIRRADSSKKDKFHEADSQVDAPKRRSPRLERLNATNIDDSTGNNTSEILASKEKYTENRVSRRSVSVEASGSTVVTPPKVGVAPDRLLGDLNLKDLDISDKSSSRPLSGRSLRANSINSDDLFGSSDVFDSESPRRRSESKNALSNAPRPLNITTSEILESWDPEDEMSPGSNRVSFAQDAKKLKNPIDFSDVAVSSMKNTDVANKGARRPRTSPVFAFSGLSGADDVSDPDAAIKTKADELAHMSALGSRPTLRHSSAQPPITSPLVRGKKAIEESRPISDAPLVRGGNAPPISQGAPRISSPLGWIESNSLDVPQSKGIDQQRAIASVDSVDDPFSENYHPRSRIASAESIDTFGDSAMAKGPEDHVALGVIHEDRHSSLSHSDEGKNEAESLSRSASPESQMFANMVEDKATKDNASASSSIKSSKMFSSAQFAMMASKFRGKSGLLEDEPGEKSVSKPNDTLRESGTKAENSLEAAVPGDQKPEGYSKPSDGTSSGLLAKTIQSLTSGFKKSSSLLQGEEKDLVATGSKLQNQPSVPINSDHQQAVTSDATLGTTAASGSIEGNASSAINPARSFFSFSNRFRAATSNLNLNSSSKDAPTSAQPTQNDVSSLGPLSDEKQPSAGEKGAQETDGGPNESNKPSSEEVVSVLAQAAAENTNTDINGRASSVPEQVKFKTDDEFLYDISDKEEPAAVRIIATRNEAAIQSLTTRDPPAPIIQSAELTTPAEASKDDPDAPAKDVWASTQSVLKTDAKKNEGITREKLEFPRLTDNIYSSGISRHSDFAWDIDVIPDMPLLSASNEPQQPAFAPRLRDETPKSLSDEVLEASLSVAIMPPRVRTEGDALAINVPLPPSHPPPSSAVVPRTYAPIPMLLSNESDASVSDLEVLEEQFQLPETENNSDYKVNSFDMSPTEVEISKIEPDTYQDANSTKNPVKIPVSTLESIPQARSRVSVATVSKESSVLQHMAETNKRAQSWVVSVPRAVSSFVVDSQPEPLSADHGSVEPQRQPHAMHPTEATNYRAGSRTMAFEVMDPEPKADQLPARKSMLNLDERTRPSVNTQENRSDVSISPIDPPTPTLRNSSFELSPDRGFHRSSALLDHANASWQARTPPSQHRTYPNVRGSNDLRGPALKWGVDSSTGRIITPSIPIDSDQVLNGDPSCVSSPWLRTQRGREMLRSVNPRATRSVRRDTFMHEAPAFSLSTTYQGSGMRLKSPPSRRSLSPDRHGGADAIGEGTGVHTWTARNNFRLFTPSASLSVGGVSDLTGGALFAKVHYSPARMSTHSFDHHPSNGPPGIGSPVYEHVSVSTSRSPAARGRDGMHRLDRGPREPSLSHPSFASSLRPYVGIGAVGGSASMLGGPSEADMLPLGSMLSHYVDDLRMRQSSHY